MARFGQRSRPSTVASSWVTSTGFSPLSLAPRAWFDAADTATITASSGSVSQWDDKSGNGFHVSQATAANQPTTGSSTLNGLNVISFDGSDVLAGATASDWTFMLSGASTTFIVCNKTGNDGSFQPVLGMRREGVGERGLIFGVDGGANLGGADVFSNSGGNGFLVDTRFSRLPKDYPATTTWLVNPSAASVADETIVYLDRFRGSRANTGTANTTTSAPAYAMRIGALPTTWFFTGQIAEIIFYNFALTTTQQRRVQAYLNRKWAL